MKFTNAKPVIEMTQAEADVVYNFITTVIEADFFSEEVDYDERFDDFVAQYEKCVVPSCEPLLNYILKIKD